MFIKTKAFLAHVARFNQHQTTVNHNFKTLCETSSKQAQAIEGIRVHLASKGQPLPPIEKLVELGSTSLLEQAARAEEGKAKNEVASAASGT